MSNRELYWSWFNDIVYNQCFLEEWKRGIQTRDLIYDTLLAVVPIAAAFLFTNGGTMRIFALLAIALNLIAQFMQSYLPIFKYKEQKCAITYALQDIDKLILEIEAFWMVIDEKPESAIALRITRFKRQYTEIDHKYLQDFNFSTNKKYIDSILKIRDSKFDRFYTQEIRQESEATTL